MVIDDIYIESLFRLRLFNFLQTITKLIARNAQQFSGAGLIASAPFHRLAHQRQLDLLQIDSHIGQLKRRSGAFGRL